MFDGHETGGGAGRNNDVRVQGRTLPAAQELNLTIASGGTRRRWMFDGHETGGGAGRNNDVRVQGRTLPAAQESKTVIMNVM